MTQEQEIAVTNSSSALDVVYVRFVTSYTVHVSTCTFIISEDNATCTVAVD